MQNHAVTAGSPGQPQAVSLLSAGIELHKACFSGLNDADAFTSLLNETAWQQDRIRLFGREHPIPRLHQWYADPDIDYSWSGLTMQPRAWTNKLLEIKALVSGACGVEFNSVLINLYRDGNDSMGWHSDDEPELGSEPVIASLSLGAARDFQLRRKDGSVATKTVRLESGDLLVMAGSSQRNWQHALPKRKRVADARINLTFRKVLSLNKSGV